MNGLSMTALSRLPEGFYKGFAGLYGAMSGIPHRFVTGFTV